MAWSRSIMRLAATMLIFIDESGNFAIDPNGHKVSCVAALVIPESFAPKVFRRFRRATQTWRNSDSEIKGSRLSEDQVAEIIRNLKRYDVLVFAACVDLGIHTEVGVSAHKASQANRYLAAAQKALKPGMKQDIEDLAQRTKDQANQLFVQATALNKLVDQVFRHATLYYSQRQPKCLASFKWIIDRKDISITEYEKLWSQTVAPYMQFHSLQEPLWQLEGADYSAFAKYCQQSKNPPDYLEPHIKDRSAPFHFIDVREILTRNIVFADSARFTGLQIADVIANAIQRACNGKLRLEGWRELGRMMVQSEKEKNCLRFLVLQDYASNQALPYANVVSQFDANCKPMVTKIKRPSK